MAVDNIMIIDACTLYFPLNRAIHAETMRHIAQVVSDNWASLLSTVGDVLDYKDANVTFLNLLNTYRKLAESC